jgi:hypothetical protein
MIANVTAGGILAFFASGMALAVVWAFLRCCAEGKLSTLAIVERLMANDGTGPTILFQLCSVLLLIALVGCLLAWLSSLL